MEDSLAENQMWGKKLQLPNLTLHCLHLKCFLSFSASKILSAQSFLTITPRKCFLPQTFS